MCGWFKYTELFSQQNCKQHKPKLSSAFACMYAHIMSTYLIWRFDSVCAWWTLINHTSMFCASVLSDTVNCVWHAKSQSNAHTVFIVNNIRAKNTNLHLQNFRKQQEFWIACPISCWCSPARFRLICLFIGIRIFCWLCCFVLIYLFCATCWCDAEVTFIQDTFSNKLK